VQANPFWGVCAWRAHRGQPISRLAIFEHNEAYASASVAVRKALEIYEGRFNIHGGSAALGHLLAPAEQGASLQPCREKEEVRYRDHLPQLWKRCQHAC